LAAQLIALLLTTGPLQHNAANLFLVVNMSWGQHLKMQKFQYVTLAKKTQMILAILLLLSVHTEKRVLLM